MACVDRDQQPNFKHHCRICKKGFMCGRALGGHMRAHGIGDENGSFDDDDDDDDNEDQASDWDEKLGDSDHRTTSNNNNNNNRRMYKLRTNPNRLKSCRICENCGKEFLSWKSFLEHGKCSSDDGGSLVSSPESEGDYGGNVGKRGCGWSKRKRSLRAKVDSFCTSSNYTYAGEEEEDLLLAGCLVDLANSRVESSSMADQQEESCTSAGKEEAERKPNLMANYVSPLSSRARVVSEKAKGVSKGMFECKACKKVFNSHQALGGHRASHKKVKGCYAAKQDQIDDSLLLADDQDVITNDEYFPSKSTTSSPLQFEQNISRIRKSKVHECSICHRVFSSGQALGGHKRCHWITSNSHDNNSFPKFHFHDQYMENIQQITQLNKSEALDLNLPAQIDPRDMPKMNNFQVSTEIHLHPLIDDVNEKSKERHYHSNEDDNHKNQDDVNNMVNVEDEADSKVKLAKLSDLKDMSTSGSSSQWLQVGIGSTADVATNP